MTSVFIINSPCRHHWGPAEIFGEVVRRQCDKCGLRDYSEVPSSLQVQAEVTQTKGDTMTSDDAIAYLKTRGKTLQDLDQSTLDANVHDKKSEEASSINCDGPERQLEYLLEDLHETDAKEVIDNLLKEE